MDVLKRVASKTPWGGKMGYLDRDWDVFPSSVLLSTRKMSKIMIIFAALSISILTLFFFQQGADVDVTVQNGNGASHVPESGHRPGAPVDEVVEDYFTGDKPKADGEEDELDDVDYDVEPVLEDPWIVKKPSTGKPPVEKPPAVNPPIEKPPVEQPPVEKPPVEKPPVDPYVHQEPPTNLPAEPVHEPPVNEHPVGEPVKDEPIVDAPNPNKPTEGEHVDEHIGLPVVEHKDEPVTEPIPPPVPPPVPNPADNQPIEPIPPPPVEHKEDPIIEPIGNPPLDPTKEVIVPPPVLADEHNEEGSDGSLHTPPPPLELEKPTINRKFVLVIPATDGGPDLCKTILTALALGYPAPVIINWKIDFHTVTGWDGGENLPKIPGFVEYLDAAMHSSAHPSEKLGEDDIVLLVDAYDIWFQLPAEVMLRRYHAINEKANARLRDEWNSTEPMPMYQTIVAASGKNCHPQPKSGSNDHCERLPPSPLRPDLYGPETEKNATKHRDHRPKYINGGLYMGPAGDIRRLFRRANEKMRSGLDRGIRLFSEQGIPGEVLGEQEIYRQWRRKHEVDDVDAMVLIKRDFEYHFGLDYSQDLSIQTFWTDTEDGLFDGAYVRLNNQTEIDQHSAALGISPVRLKGLPDDVKAVKNPLAGIVDAPDWGDMPLYADFWTETVPVILHHNGFKERRVTWWHKPWFTQHLRKLLVPRLLPGDPSKAMATVETETENFAYWAPLAEATDRKPRRMEGSAKARLGRMEFQEVCKAPEGIVDDEDELVPVGPPKEWWEEVFRDTQGPLV